MTTAPRGTTAKYYVQCHPDERLRTKSIAAKALLTNGKTYSTAEYGTPGFLSKVTIEALEEKIYTTDDMKLEREDTANGNKTLTYKYFRCLGRSCRWKDIDRTIQWDQDNYYLSIIDPRFYIKKADIDGYINNEGDRQVSKYAFYNRFPEDNNGIFNVGYIWPINDDCKSQSKNVTLYTAHKVDDRNEVTNNISVDITINQKEKAFSLTRIRYNSGYYPIWRGLAIKEKNLDMSFLPPGTHIFIYDQYGNKGEFHARPDDDNGWGNYIKVLNGPYNG